jgi:hypothetical protein
MKTWPFDNTTLDLVKDKKSSGEIKDLVNDFIKAIEKKSVLDGKVDLEYVIAYMQAFMTRQAIITPSIALAIERDIENIK